LKKRGDDSPLFVCTGFFLQSQVLGR